jgi:SAM-dependent methyltransferase
MDYHAAAVEKLRIQCGIEGKLDRALDVGCGTGLSSLSLARIGRRVVGADVALAMIAQAETIAGVEFVVATAEALPFDSRAFDLVTSFSAFHWFDQDAFLAEAHRVLIGGGHLCFAQHGFTGQVEGHPEFARWRRDVVEPRYPSGQKQVRDWRRGLPGFQPVQFEPFVDPRWLSRGDIVAYMMSQSAIERSGERPEEIHAWLLEETDRLLGSADAYRCTFQGYVSSYRAVR